MHLDVEEPFDVFSRLSASDLGALTDSSYAATSTSPTMTVFEALPRWSPPGVRHQG